MGKGHQQEKGVRDLDWWAQMNDKVDSDAKSFLAVYGQFRTPLFDLCACSTKTGA